MPRDAEYSTPKTVGGKAILLVIRPQEVVAAIQALAQSYNDYFPAVADYNRAQFRLYRALGQPAQLLAGQGPDAPAVPPDCGTAVPAALPSLPQGPTPPSSER
jgi:hypothetical protein